jgi:hypothetical protein
MAFPTIRLQELKKTTQNTVGRDSRCTGRGSKQEPLEYKPGYLRFALHPQSRGRVVG